MDYQKKFQDFQKECLIDEQVLRDWVTGNRRRSGQIWQLLRDGSQARTNLEAVLKAKPDIVVQFFETAGCNVKYDDLPDDLQPFQAFLQRLAQNSYIHGNREPASADWLLYDILADFLKHLGDPDLDLPEDAIDQWPAILLARYGFQMLDTETGKPEPSSITGSLSAYIDLASAELENLDSQDNRGIDRMTSQKNLVREVICGNVGPLEGRRVIEILKEGAPETLWEMACLQAGISKLEVIKKGGK